MAIKLLPGRYEFRFLPVPVAERSEARACGRSLARIAGSNPTSVIDVCVVCKHEVTSQDNQDEETSTEKLQTENKE
jgi:hypothetical protein